MRFPNATPEEIKQAHGYAYGGAIIQDMGYYPHGSFFFRAWWSRRQSRGIRMHVAQNFHHMLWIWEHWKLDGIVGGGAVFAITYSILNAVRNKTLNSKVLTILRERATPMTEQEISRLLDIPLARLQQRIDSLFGQGLIEQVADPHWQERAQRGWRPRDQRAARPVG